MGQETYEVKDDSTHNASDEEKGGPPVYVSEAPAVRGDVFITGDSTYAKIQRFVSRFGVEPRGIERVPEDERTDKSLVKVGTMVCFAPSTAIAAPFQLPYPSLFPLPPPQF